LPWREKNMDGKKILYSLNVNDAQDVAKKEFKTTLTDPELKQIYYTTEDHMHWYTAMTEAVQELIEDQR